MGDELTYDKGLAVTLHYTLANCPANATTALTLDNGGAGFKVPTGYKFHAMCLHGESDTDLTAGTLTFKVRASGTALTGGPTAALSDTVQAAVGVVRPGADPIAAAAIVAVEAVASAALAPATCGLDAVLIGVLLPA